MDHNDLSKETKLSQVIEEALVSGKYRESSHYMCIALRRMRKEQHVSAIQDMVSSINKHMSAYRDQPLLCALDSAGIFIMEDHNYKEQTAYTTELYCWWVFDLKRKGL